MKRICPDCHTELGSLTRVVSGKRRKSGVEYCRQCAGKRLGERDDHGRMIRQEA